MGKMLGKGPSLWDTYTSQPGIVAEGATGQTACNSYYFYQKDVDALKSLNVNNQDLLSIITILRPSLSLCICCANL
jgi:beta-glucosidase/6-phospho-beta-glucosidase/beta-galactosidase